MADIPTIILAGIALAGLVAAVLAFFYRRGGQEQILTAAIRENTVSNMEVTKELRDFKSETIITLRDYGWRLKILEDKNNEHRA
jgi:hypothetical protein